MISQWTFQKQSIHMKKIQPRASPSASTERSPFKDVTNTPIHGNASVQSEKKLSWYARLSDEKKAEHLQKQIGRAHV